MKFSYYLLSVFGFLLPSHSFSQMPATDIIFFRIKAGTGRGSWNTRDNPVEVKVGQTLRILNDDSIAHYLHTPDAPCPHGTGSFSPGESYDCVIDSVADPDTLLFDHQFGTRARFYVRATN